MNSPAQILTGEAFERDPRAAHDMTEAEARHVLRQIEAQMPKARRGKSVRFFATNGRRLTDDARALYDAYAKAYGA